MHPILNRLRRSGTALTLAGALVSVPVLANNLGYAIATDNWTFTGTAQVDVPGMQTNIVTKPSGQRMVIVFSAECAAVAPSGNYNAWLDVDIVLLNPTTGAVVYTAAPTAGSGDAFCASNGNGSYSWSTHSVQALIPYNFAAGNYRVGVKARLNGGATTGWLGERMVSVGL